METQICFKIGFRNMAVQLVKPGVVPPLIGRFVYNTVDQVSYRLDNIFPSNTRIASIAVYTHMGNDPSESDVNIWLWTECDGGIRDIKYKKAFRSRSGYAVPYDSETFNFAFCPSNPRIFLLCDSIRNHGNVWLDLYAVDYSDV